MSCMTTLWLNSNHIQDLSVISGMPALRDLWLRDNLISDLSPLSGSQQLETVALKYNQISDVSPLTTAKIEWVIDLTCNPLGLADLPQDLRLRPRPLQRH